MNSTQQKLFKQAQACLQHAYVPYSKFHVSACVRSAEGDYFSGCNVENASYGLTLCAEANAISTMAAQGHREIAEILIMSQSDSMITPCGACRQRIREFANDNTQIHLCNAEKIIKTYTINELLPDSFGPQYLSEASK